MKRTKECTLGNVDGQPKTVVRVLWLESLVKQSETSTDNSVSKATMRDATKLARCERRFEKGEAGESV